MDSKAKLPAGLSLDLDNAWSYLKTHGSRAWRELPSYLDVLVPRALDLLEELGLRITFFIVGQDAALARHHRVLRLIVERGHEVGNHSFSHEPWLHLYDPARIAEEIDQSARAIEEATGARPRGFRGPGFSVSPAVLEALADRGYLYDASTLPTYLGPLARLYYFRRARLST
ncbi:MAG: polysaccharide deacetylase, partial [Candidatus Dadabacteria bacterium]